MSERKLNPSQALILAALLGNGPMVGADIVREASAMEFYTFSRSQIYREISIMWKRELIDITSVNGRTDLLSITDEGKEFYLSCPKDCEVNEDTEIRDSWYLRLRLAILDGGGDVEGIARQAEASHRAAARAQRHRGLPGQMPPVARALAACHEAMADYFRTVTQEVPTQSVR